jgi:hypothetical protein
MVNLYQFCPYLELVVDATETILIAVGMMMLFPMRLRQKAMFYWLAKVSPLSTPKPPKKKAKPSLFEDVLGGLN